MQGAANSSKLAQDSCKNWQNMQVDELDKLDWRIIDALENQGRITFDELAGRIGLSPSATLRRVKRLEDAGVIVGYTAVIAPEKLGLALTAYLNVRLAKQSADEATSPIDAFSAAVQAWPEVVDCVALTGEMDYLLHVRVRDMQHYSRFVLDKLLRHPAVLDCKTSFMLRRLKPLPPKPKGS
jgi:Lrp/AsnC family leucine-responsive transcriptional regulator